MNNRSSLLPGTSGSIHYYTRGPQWACYSLSAPLQWYVYVHMLRVEAQIQGTFMRRDLAT